VAEERERAATETAVTAARLVMAELAATATDAARAVAAEFKALRVSSTDSSVSTNDDGYNKLKLAREATWEQAAQWAAVHPPPGAPWWQP
jgi:hypothetical protein